MSTQSEVTGIIRNVPLVAVVPSRWQPRQLFDPDQLLELTLSIQEHGLLDPVLVFHNEDGEPELVAGERRVRASTAVALVTHSPAWIAANGDELKRAVNHLGKHGWVKLADQLKADLAEITILARVLEGFDHAALHKIALVENLQRESLSPLEEAAALRGLQDELGLSQRQLADHIGKSQGWVQQRLALLDAAPAIQDRVNTRVFTPTHVRAFAGLPEGVQTAIADRVEQMLKAEGDSGITTRKVQAFGSSAREFLQPERWDVPPAADTAEPLQVAIRNGRMLLAYLVQTTDEEQLGRVVVKLREANLLGKKPDCIDGQSLGAILSAFNGDKPETWTSLATQWDKWAIEAGFNCDSCLWAMVHDVMPAEHPLSTGCLRLDRRDRRNGIHTCSEYIRADDPRWPAILPLHHDLTYHLHETDRRLSRRHGYAAASPADYPALYREAVATSERKQQQAKAAEAKAHLPGMRAYQALQSDPATFLDLDHPQAHVCARCASYRPDQAVDGVACHYAAQPKRKPGWHSPQGPDYRVMVSRAGTAVPRCEYFVASDPTALIDADPTPGALPRKAVLSWLHHLLVGKGSSHEAEIPRLLSWLTYPEDDAEKRVRRVRELWDRTSDGHIVRLMNVLISERVATNGRDSVFSLFNSKTGEAEEWCGVGWDTILSRKPPERFSITRLPDGWPMPWVLRQEQKKGLQAPAARRNGGSGTEPAEKTEHASIDQEVVPLGSTTTVGMAA